MPPSVNCDRAQCLLRCELLLPRFELSISIHSDGTADMRFKGTKQGIENNLFRARLLFDRIFKISREQIDKCIYPLIPSGYNRDVVLGQTSFKLNCIGAQTSDGIYSADIRHDYSRLVSKDIYTCRICSREILKILSNSNFARNKLFSISCFVPLTRISAVPSL